MPPVHGRRRKAVPAVTRDAAIRHLLGEVSAVVAEYAETSREVVRAYTEAAEALAALGVARTEFPDWLADIVVPKEEYRP